MNTNRFIRHMGLVATLSLIGWLPALPTYAAEQPSVKSTPSAQAEGPSIASGAAEDTLKACLVRIPKDASTGQRRMAEQGCERDEGTRELIDAVPGR